MRLFLTLRLLIAFIVLLPLQSNGLNASVGNSKPASAPKVLVTIKPIHSIVANVMKGVGEPQLLLEGHEDPHHFQMTVESTKRLQNIDLLFWVSPNFETFLVKPIQTFKPRRATLINTKGVNLLYQRDSSGCFYDDACIKPREFRSVESSLELITEWTAVDPHIWLDVENVKKLVREIAYHLSAIDLGNAKTYNENADAYIDRLTKLHDSLKERAQRIKHFHFVAFHDAYSYLEKAYDFHNAGAELVTEHGKPSLKSMEKIRSAIERRKVNCFFVEPQHPSTVEQSLAKEYDVVLYEIDPLGIEIPTGLSHYEDMMNKLFDTFESCVRDHGLGK